MEKKKLFGKTLKDQLTASLQDRLYTFVLAQDTIRGVVLNGTRMVNEMRWNHELGILESMVLGRAYLGAALMSAGLKGKDRLSVNVECSGPIRGLVVEANAFGEVRGYLKQVPIPIEKPVESFDLSPFFGAGFLSVSKFLEDAKHPFTGTVMLEHGNLAEDLAVYFQKSEQVQTAFVLSISFDPQGEIQAAGGLFLQALPGADESVLAEIEKKVRRMPMLANAVTQQGFPEQWLQDQLGVFNPKLLDKRGVEFMCHCSHERLTGYLMMLDLADIREMAENGPFPIEIRCHHCNTTYPFSEEEMQAIYTRRIARS